MGVLSNLSIRTKLTILVVVSVIVPFAVIAVSGTLSHQRMVDDRVATVRAVVETGIGLAKGLQAEVEAGTLTRDEALERFRNALHSMYYNGGADYMYAYDMKGIAVANPSNHKAVGTDRTGLKDKSPEQKLFVREMVDTMQRQDSAIVHYSWPKLGSEVPLEKTNYVQRFQPLGVIIGSGVYTDDIDEAYQAFMVRLATTALALIGVLVATAFLINRDIHRSLLALRTRMSALAAGDLTVRFPEAGRRTEIGAMAQALEVFRENAETRQRLEAEHAEMVERTAKEKRLAMETLAATFENSVGDAIRSITAETETLQKQAQTMLAAASETGKLATTVSATTEQTSTNVQTVASASEQLSASIDEISRHVNVSGRIAGEAVGQAQRANTKVGGLAEAVEKIGAVVGLINDIASQTNLLALNATIEAARAGEAGKGFAVVASEVKQLATQTAKATEDITVQISGIQTVTNDAVLEIRGIAEVIGQINENTITISSAVEEQGAATREIVRNIQEAASGTREVASDIGGVSGAADQSGKAAQGVLGTSQLLASQADALNREVATFLRTVRQA
ncbi:methyl-accepting chemotaxis protein [Azospirillum sp. ST 5-10]|uniref:methyl-accepting chemotaxis protein n=1 Tax=Azospirillum sp. ST 5-10 TaxID=3445776 RepID=UPI003F4A1784